MYHNRLIPCLLLHKQGLIKTKKFTDGRYLGDPVNAVKIYNDREVDELLVLDIDATREKRGPNFDYLIKLTQQCFMPVGYGGGIRSLDDIRHLFEIGFEKVAIGASAYENAEMVEEASSIFGVQSIICVMDTMRNGLGWGVYIRNGTIEVSHDPVEYALFLEANGAGEIFLNSIDRDGTKQGYDIDLINMVSSAVSVPVVACGGSGRLVDCKQAIVAGASAAAAGSLFVYWGRRDAVLINYPDKEEIEKIL